MKALFSVTIQYYYISIIETTSNPALIIIIAIITSNLIGNHVGHLSATVVLKYLTYLRYLGTLLTLGTTAPTLSAYGKYSIGLVYLRAYLLMTKSWKEPRYISTS